MNNYHVLTLFPDQVETYFNTSITGRAVTKGLVSLECLHIRDFATNTYGKIDDTMYGGGTGLLIQCEPVYRAWSTVADKCEKEGKPKPHTVYMSPKGYVFDQKKAHELTSYEDLVIICGHYEGIDSRVIDEICDEEISIGDYILTGGETAAIVIMDAVTRLIPGVLPNEEAYTNESHTAGILEAPQYTKPPVWHGREVPEVLKNGNDALIADFNHTQALAETLKKRPDMFDKLELTEDEIKKVLALQKPL